MHFSMLSSRRVVYTRALAFSSSSGLWTAMNLHKQEKRNFTLKCHSEKFRFVLLWTWGFINFESHWWTSQVTLKYPTHVRMWKHRREKPQEKCYKNSMWWWHLAKQVTWSLALRAFQDTQLRRPSSASKSWWQRWTGLGWDGEAQSIA